MKGLFTPFFSVLVLYGLAVQSWAFTFKEEVLLTLNSNPEWMWEIEISQDPECPYINCSKAYLMARGWWGVNSDRIYNSENADHDTTEEEGVTGHKMALSNGE